MPLLISALIKQCLAEGVTIIFNSRELHFNQIAFPLAGPPTGSYFSVDKYAVENTILSPADGAACTRIWCKTIRSLAMYDNVFP